MSIHTVVLVSDIHFPVHHKKAWENVVEFCEDYRPQEVVAAGDIVDLQMLSKYTPDEQANLDIGGEIEMAAQEMNRLSAHSSRFTIIGGNHDERWEKAILGARIPLLRDCVGLTLEDQFRSKGLRRDAVWFRETATKPYYVLGKGALHVLHGHNQGGGSRTIASRNASMFAGVSTIMGHHHRGQHFTTTVFDKTHHSIANPTLCGPQEYRKTPNWQRGFTFLEFYGRSRLRDCTKFTPHLIVMDSDGGFSFGGKVYGCR